MGRIQDTHAIECPACHNKVMVEVPKGGSVRMLCPYCYTESNVTSELRTEKKKP